MAVARKVSSLVLLRKEGSVLLGYKKRGFGAGKWNGFGGKKEEGETMYECAKRELLEESGIESNSLVPVGHLEFEFVQEPMFMDVTVFTATHFTGEPKETEEMKPRWFAEDDIPFSEMWADDEVWFPYFLSGFKFRGRFKFQDHDTLTWHQIECMMMKPGVKPYNRLNACQNCLQKQELFWHLYRPSRDAVQPFTCPHMTDEYRAKSRPSLSKLSTNMFRI